MERLQKNREPSEIFVICYSWGFFSFPTPSPISVQAFRVLPLSELNAIGLVSFRVPLEMATNKRAAPSEVILRGLGIFNVFKVVVGGDSAPRRKPMDFALRTMAGFFCR